MDQIAALQWVKDNIGAFGGDNKAVTLMGHGTGAACVNLLMVSPIARGEIFFKLYKLKNTTIHIFNTYYILLKFYIYNFNAIIYAFSFQFNSNQTKIENEKHHYKFSFHYFFLMPGLFHRAILMSGSALSDWALANHPLQSTMQVVQGLNCPLRDDHEEMLICLRKKR